MQCICRKHKGSFNIFSMLLSSSEVSNGALVDLIQDGLRVCARTHANVAEGNAIAVTMASALSILCPVLGIAMLCLLLQKFTLGATQSRRNVPLFPLPKGLHVS